MPNANKKPIVIKEASLPYLDYVVNNKLRRRKKKEGGIKSFKERR